VVRIRIDRAQVLALVGCWSMVRIRLDRLQVQALVGGRIVHG
jgi:hypothetical protein